MNYFIFLITLFFFKLSYAIDINDSVKSTIENNSKVKIAYEKLIESKEIIEKSFGNKLPSITSTISGTYTSSEDETSTSSTTPETFTDKYKITITQNLFDGGVNNLEIDRSNILYNNEILNFKKKIQELILNAIEGYLTVINFQKSLDVNKKNYDSVSRFLDETKTRYELGSATLYDLQNAESAFALAETSLFIANQNYIISKKTFKRIVSKEAINLEDVIDIDVDINFENMLTNVKNNNLDLLLLKNDILNKEFLLSKEKNSKKPSLDLSASAEYSDAGRIDSGTESTKGTIALTLTVPIFQQNIDNSDIRKYQSQRLQSELLYNDYLEDLEIQASDLFKNYQISKSNLNLNLKRIKSIETSLKIIQEEFNIGTKSITDLIDEESELLLVKEQYFEARKDHFLNYFKIKALESSLIDLFSEYLPNYN